MNNGHFLKSQGWPLNTGLTVFAMVGLIRTVRSTLFEVKALSYFCNFFEFFEKFLFGYKRVGLGPLIKSCTDFLVVNRKKLKIARKNPISRIFLR